MVFEEHNDGDFHVYAGAIEAHWGKGYTAALVVSQQGRGGGGSAEIFRDDQLAQRRHWPTTEAALRYAMRKGQQVVDACRHADHHAQHAVASQPNTDGGTNDATHASAAANNTPPNHPPAPVATASSPRETP